MLRTPHLALCAERLASGDGRVQPLRGLVEYKQGEKWLAQSRDEVSQDANHRTVHN
jgi:hypothetical protein